VRHGGGLPGRWSEIERTAESRAAPLPGNPSVANLTDPLPRRFGRAAGARLPLAETTLWLSGIVVASFVLRLLLGRLVHSAFLFLDELGYEQTAFNVARHGRLAVFDRAGLGYSPLYPALLSPIYALTSSADQAYGWVKAVNALLMSLSIVPAYGVARFVLPRRWSLAVAGLTAVAPLMLYSSLVLSENLAYPLFLVAAWALLRALREPRPRNDVVLLAAIALACAARLQLVALVPIALTAVLVVGMFDARRGGPPLRSSLRAHSVLLIPVVLAAAAVVVAAAARGGSIPLAGRYSTVGSAHPSAWSVVELAVRHLAGLDLGLGVAPFAAALVCGWLLVRGEVSRNALVFGWTAAAAIAWIVLETAFDAAAYDREPSRTPSVRPPPDLPRIHERYLIYLVPLFLVALAASLRRADRGLRRVPVVAAAAVAAVLPVAIPFTKVINHTMIGDSLGLQLFGKTVRGGIEPIAHPTKLAIVLATLLAATYVVSAVGRYRLLAVPMTALVLVFLSALAGLRFVSSANGSTRVSFSGHADWVDRRAAGRPVILVGGRGVSRVALVETAFHNLTIGRAYFTCKMAFGGDYGETQALLRRTGALEVDGRPLRAPLAVVPVSLGVRGRVLARDPRARLALVEPARGVLALAPAGRRAFRSCPSLG
jgi:hypothetical protein